MVILDSKKISPPMIGLIKSEFCFNKYQMPTRGRPCRRSLPSASLVTCNKWPDLHQKLGQMTHFRSKIRSPSLLRIPTEDASGLSFLILFYCVYFIASILTLFLHLIQLEILRFFSSCGKREIHKLV